tara:strand:- start:1243 stop:1881 length:639 start_codon:yes stop_codon:yes gene_type:complete
MKNKVRRFGTGGDTSPDFSRLTFKEAFQAARGGPNAKEPMNKTFTWNGKKYNTNLAASTPKAESKKAEDKKADKVSDVKDPQGVYDDARRMKLEREDKPLEGVHPEMLLPIGRVIKGLSAAAALSRGAPKETPKRTEGSLENTARMDSQQAAAQGSKRDPKNMDEVNFADDGNPNFKRGGKVKKMASGGMARSASSRGDGCAQRGKTKGRMV